jgi:hypothetical protein
MKKALKVFLGVLVILLAGIWLVGYFFGGTLIAKAVTLAGPKIMGVPVELDGAGFHLLRGRAVLRGLRVGNPGGFRTPHAFELGRLEVILDLGSLKSDTVVIKRVLIERPEITYERGLTASNLGRLIEQLGGEKPGKETPGGGKKVVIEDLSINGARVNVSLTAMGGMAAPLPLPPLHLKDLGKEKAGASVPEVIRGVLGAVLKSVTTVLTSSGKLVGEGVEKAGEAAVDAAKTVGKDVADLGGAVTKGASRVIEDVTGIFRKPNRTESK